MIAWGAAEVSRERASRFFRSPVRDTVSPMSRAAFDVARPHRLTLEEWAALDEDVEGELVDGTLEEEEMSSFLHEMIASWLNEVLRRWVRRRGGQVAGSETKLAVGLRRGRKPDLSLFLRGKLPGLDDALVRTTPHLVVEVASPRPRDARRDRIDKLRDYARAGIRYYWILDPRLRSLEVFELGARSRYALIASAAEGRVRIPGCAGLRVDLDALWREVDEAARPPVRSGRKKR
jgi:Uma2 family endonuclease